MKRMFSLLVLLLLLTGSTQLYTQETDISGSSVIEEKRDVSLYISALPAGGLEDIQAVCESYEALNCSVAGTVITSRISISPQNQYYNLRTEYGVPSITYTMRINMIPTDLFDARMSDILIAAGIPSDKGLGIPIDLNNAAVNRARAEAFRKTGTEVNYTVRMPNGEAFTYDLVALLDDSKPIVIKTYGLNMAVIILIIGIIAVGAMAYYFFGKKRNMRR